MPITNDWGRVLKSRTTPRWRCVACKFATDDPIAGETHFASAEHRANTYLQTPEDRIEDLLELRKELER
jgi:hypothetical protein